MNFNSLSINANIPAGWTAEQVKNAEKLLHAACASLGLSGNISFMTFKTFPDAVATTSSGVKS